MTYRWLLFDADGTLFDFDAAEQKALRESFEQFGMAFLPQYAQTYHQVNAQVWKEFEKGEINQGSLRTVRFERLFAVYGIQPPVDGGLERFSQAYLDNLARHGDLMDGAEEVVRQLAPRYRMAIITNGIASVQRSRFNHSPLAAYFSDLIISEEIGAAKPESGYFDAAFKRIGSPPREQVLVIGDSLTSDIRGGLDYGMDTCWFNPCQIAPDPACLPRYEIGQLEELFAILDAG